MAELNLTYNAMKMELTIYPIDSQRLHNIVEVVRCKDCMHYKPQNVVPRHHGTVNYCKRAVTLKMPPGGFCCYGERKDNA